MTIPLRFDWTDAKIADARRLWGESYTARDIARILGPGLSRNSVIGKLHRIGLTSKDQPSFASRPVRTHAKKEPTRLGPIYLAIKQDGLTGLPPDQSPDAISLFDVGEDQCRWPVSEPGAPFLFCGTVTVSGCSWCARHARLAYTERRGGWTRPDVSARLRRQHQQR